jgi:transportin-3
MFALFDALLAKYGKLYFVSERVGSVLRRGLAFFPTRALEPVLEVVLGRMVASFSETGYASFIWIVGKLAAKFGDASRGPSGDNVGRILGGAFERIAEDLKKLVAIKPAESIPDGELL